MLHNDNQHSIKSVYKQQTQFEQKQNNLDNTSNKIQNSSVVYNQKILQNLNHTQKQFYMLFWKYHQINRIQYVLEFLFIYIQHQCHKYSSNISEFYINQINWESSLSDWEYQKQLIQAQNTYNNQYLTLKKLKDEKLQINKELQFDKWVKSMKGKNFIGWFMMLRETGPQLKKLVISKQMLKMLGYQPQQFSLQMQKYPQLTADFWSNNAYKTIMLNYIRSLCKFISMQINGNISLEQCINESCMTLLNQIKGKNQTSIKVQMKMFLPNIATVCYEVVRVVDRREFLDYQRMIHRNSLILKANKDIYNSLYNIVKLPKDMNPLNTNKICSYITTNEQNTIQSCIEQQKNELKEYM